MAAATKLTRRTFLGRIAVAALATLVLAPFGRKASAAPAPHGGGNAPRKPKPLNTCGGWTDRNGDGVCERSEAVSKPCGAIRCPANKGNANWAGIRKKGAPKGVCALWDATTPTGVCSLSARAENPCLCTQCPAAAKKSGAAGIHS